MRLLLLTLALATVGGLQAQLPSHPPAGDFSRTEPTFNEKLHGRPSDPSPVVIVLFPDKTYLEFFPADVLTLRQLVDKLPKGTLKKNSRLHLIRKYEGLTFSPSGLKSEDLTRYSLAGWDLIKIED